jgi:hypothetical protein
MSRPMREVIESLQTRSLIPRQPSVQRLSTNALVPRHLGHRPTFRNYRQNRLVPLLRHAHLPHARECHPSAGTPVRHQPKHWQASSGTLLSCFSRISTSDEVQAQGFEPWTIGLKVVPDLRSTPPHAPWAYWILRTLPPDASLSHPGLAIRNGYMCRRSAGDFLSERRQ